MRQTFYFFPPRQIQAIFPTQIQAFFHTQIQAILHKRIQANVHTQIQAIFHTQIQACLGLPVKHCLDLLENKCLDLRVKNCLDLRVKNSLDLRMKKVQTFKQARIRSQDVAYLYVKCNAQSDGQLGDTASISTITDLQGQTGRQTNAISYSGEAKEAAIVCRELSLMWGVHTIFQAGASKDNGVKLQKIIDARIGVDNEINRRFETNGLNEGISAFLNDCVQPVASAAESAVKKTGARPAAGPAPGSKRKKQGN